MRKVFIYCIVVTFLVSASIPAFAEELKRPLSTVTSTVSVDAKLEADKILVAGIESEIVTKLRAKGLAYRTIALICGIAEKSSKTPEEVARLFVKLGGIDKVASELKVSQEDMKQIRNNLEVLKKNSREKITVNAKETEQNLKKYDRAADKNINNKSELSEKVRPERIKEIEELKNQLRETVVRQLRQEFAEKVKQQLKDELRERVRQELRVELRESILRELKNELNNNGTKRKATEVQKAQPVENSTPQVNKVEEKGKGISLVETLVSVSGKSREEVVEVLKTERELGKISKKLGMTDEQYKELMQKLTLGK